MADDDAPRPSDAPLADEEPETPGDQGSVSSLEAGQDGGEEEDGWAEVEDRGSRTSIVQEALAFLKSDDWDAAAKASLEASTPVGRLGQPSDVVAALTYLIEHDYVTGETLVVDGGRRIR